MLSNNINMKKDNFVQLQFIYKVSYYNMYIYIYIMYIYEQFSS